MKKQNNKVIFAFTLIELLISMTIFFIIVIASYVPYNFYMNKVKVRNTIKEISQSLYEVRNMAINWISDVSNVSMWLYIDVKNNPNLLQFYSYPYSYTWSQITNELNSNIKLVKSYELIDWMDIKSIAWKSKFLFFFDAITWDWKYFYFNESWRHDFIWNEIEILFSYKGATIGSPLSWELKYFTGTNIVDY